MAELPDVDSTVLQIESLLERLGEVDPGTRAMAEDLVRHLMQLYGAGLAKMLEIVQRDGGSGLTCRLGEDRLVGSLLLLHGLHPADVATRVVEALRRVERRLDREHLALANIADGVARVRVEHNGSASAPPGLREAIERAIAESAPDLDGVEIEGLPTSEPALVQILPAAS